MLWKQHCKLKGLKFPHDCPHTSMFTQKSEDQKEFGDKLFKLADGEDLDGS